MSSSSQSSAISGGFGVRGVNRPVSGRSIGGVNGSVMLPSIQNASQPSSNNTSARSSRPQSRANQ